MREWLREWLRELKDCITELWGEFTALGQLIVIFFFVPLVFIYFVCLFKLFQCLFF